MPVTKAYLMVLRSARENPTRTVLTTLSIALGVATAMVVVGLGDGVAEGMGESLSRNHSTVTLTRVTALVPGAPSAEGLNDGDVAALEDGLEPASVIGVVPLIEGRAVMRARSNTYSNMVVGASPRLLQARSLTLAAGSMFTDDQYRNKARVAVIGQTIVAVLFGGSIPNALGSKLQIGRHTFTVIGVLDRSGASDGAAVIPTLSARAFLFGGTDGLSGISVIVRDLSRIPTIGSQVNDIMDRRRHVTKSVWRDYYLPLPTNFVQNSLQSLTVLSWFVAAVATGLLLIGGVGVTSLALLTVRRRAADIRRHLAVGVSRGVLVRFFLLESTMLTGFGAVLGVGVGIGSLRLIELHLMPRFLAGHVSAPVPVAAASIAVGICLVVGMLAGAYPAWRAVRERGVAPSLEPSPGVA